MTCFPVTTIGEADENGTYDGGLGYIQRNEANTYFGFGSYALPYEPGIFIPSPQPGFAGRIYSIAFEARSMAGGDILYLFSNFSVEMWMYFFIAFGLCSTILVYPDIRFKFGSSKSTWKMSRLTLRKYVSTFYNYFLLSIDNSPTVISRLLSMGILWTSIVISMCDVLCYNVISLATSEYFGLV